MKRVVGVLVSGVLEVSSVARTRAPGSRLYNGTSRLNMDDNTPKDTYKQPAMIHFELIREKGILTVTPEGPLESADFKRLAEAVDPVIEAEGDLQGLLIDAPVFPGWRSFGDLVSHFKFVKNHERHIRKVAVVSDSGFLTVMPHVARHFVHAEVRHFASGEKDQAFAWLTTNPGK